MLSYLQIKSCYIFHNKAFRANYIYYSYKFLEQVISGIVYKLPANITCHTETLTRRTAYNNIHRFSFGKSHYFLI